MGWINADLVQLDEGAEVVAPIIAYAEIHTHDGSTAQSIPTGLTYTKITSLTDNGASSNCTADAANNKITITEAGDYKIDSSMSFFSSVNNTVFFVSAFAGGVEQNNIHFTRKVATAADIGNASACGIATINTVPVDLDFRVRHDGAGSTDLTIQYMNINAIKLN